MKTKILSVLILSVTLLAACLPNASSVSTPTGTQTVPAPAVTQAVPSTGVTPEPTHIRVDLTPAQRLAMQALSEQHNIAIDQITLVSTEAETWTDGCLEVVIPGMMCTQALVDGFRIIFSANGQKYEYHTNQDGTQVIEATSLLAPTP
jgi:hypothetical protein